MVDAMTSDQLEVLVIVILILAFAGMSIWCMLLHERVHQLTGYIKRLDKEGIKTRMDL